MQLHARLPLAGLVVGMAACGSQPDGRALALGAADAPAEATFGNLITALNNAPANLNQLESIDGLTDARVRVIAVDLSRGNQQSLLERAVHDTDGNLQLLRALLAPSTGASEPRNAAVVREVLARQRIPIGRVVALDVDVARGQVTIFRS